MVSLLILFVASCRTFPPLAPVNLAEPGWILHQGQAVWQTKRDAPEIAGEIIFATHPKGGTMMQFTKNPLPFVTAQTSNDAWQIEFVPEQRRFSGKGTPTTRLLWIHLSRALNGVAPPSSLRFERTETNAFTLENPETGERISGFLSR